MMTKGRIIEQVVTQGNQQQQDGIDLGSKCKKVTIKNLLTSTKNVSIGWGAPGGANVLVPGESVTYFAHDIVLDGNILYIGFSNPATTGGVALVSIISDTGMEVC
jgi:hypothetical protein